MPTKYQALQSDEIRVLTIDTAENDNLPIRCRLEHVRLPSPSPENLHRVDNRFMGDSYIWPELTQRAAYDEAALFKRSVKVDSGAPTSLNNGANTDGPGGAPIMDDRNLPWRYGWGDYMAISYVWGHGPRERSITLDGEPFSVRANLFDLLLHLRRTQRIRQGFKAWIDALCINQDDLEERVRQVARMRDIYESAWQVVTWLGEEAHDSGLAITALTWMATLPKESGSLGRIYGSHAAVDLRPLLIVWERPKPLWREEVYCALFHFFARDYWHRMWILQEVAMARHDAPVICGNRCLSWKNIYDAAVVIDGDRDRLGHDIIESVRPRLRKGWSFEYARDRRPTERGSSSERLWKLPMEMMALQRDQKLRASTEDPSRRLRRPLLLARDAFLTEEKDRVFGILSIRAIADGVSLVPEVAISLPELYRRFMTQLISKGDLDPLRFISTQRTALVFNGSLPTPDETPGPLRDILKSVLGRGSEQYMRSKRPRHSYIGEICTHNLPTWAVCWTCKQAPVAPLHGVYRAGGCALRFPPSMLPHSTGLVVKGLIFDTISTLGAFHPDEVDQRYPANPPVEPEPPLRGGTGLELARSALWRTIVGDTTEDGGVKAPDTYSWLLHPGLWQRGIPGVYPSEFGLGALLSRNKDLLLGGYKLEHLVLGVPDSTSWRQQRRQASVYNPTDQQRRALSWAMNVLAWRRLTGTEMGRIGLTPAVALLGDKIAVLVGCSVPMVLRPCQDGWNIIGECYVHGVMDGEVLEGKIELQDITLY